MVDSGKVLKEGLVALDVAQRLSVDHPKAE